ncbi:arginine--tRNA ligase, partial [Myxococcota bacterium]|nr:arginine--tRNA ligase [Myxococcota bacterium]
MQTIKTHIIEAINEAVKTLIKDGFLPAELVDAPVQLERPKVKEHGDLSVNFAMANSKAARMAPRLIAQKIVEHLSQKRDLFSRVEVAGPGFINLSIADRQLIEGLGRINSAGALWGKAAARDIRINLEFVSANPTGPLHVGHGRGAAVGDALARLLRQAGYDVTCEYYLNDAGRQVNNLAASIWCRYLELCAVQDSSIGTLPFPEDGYQGAYVKEMAQKYFAIHGVSRALTEKDMDELKAFGIQEATAAIKETLSTLGVSFDLFFSEKSLHESGALRHAVEVLTDRNELYEQDGAIFFRSTTYGDEKDRVVVR